MDEFDKTLRMARPWDKVQSIGFIGSDLDQESLYNRRKEASSVSCSQWRRQLWGTGARATPRLPRISFLVHFWSKSDSQLSKYRVVCEISCCRS